MKNYKQPEFKETNYNCPHCDVLTSQYWFDMKECLNAYNNSSNLIIEEELYVVLCHNCREKQIWYNTNMVYPDIVTVPLATEDMPESVKEIYNEAREISNKSPRATAALLRVALEKLTEELGESKGTLNTRIGNLKNKGLSQNVINSLDSVRIIANEGGSHSGQIDLTGQDGPEIVNSLFKLINYIVDQTITKPKEADDIFNNLPQDKLIGIKNRDNQN